MELNRSNDSEHAERSETASRDDSVTIDAARAAGWAGILWTGEAGSGKTSLLEHTVAESERALVIRTRKFVRGGEYREGAAIEALLCRLGASESAFNAGRGDESVFARLLAGQLDVVAADRRVVLVADDIDRMDAWSRDVLLDALAQCSRDVMLLASAVNASVLDESPIQLKVLAVARCTELHALAVLREKVGREVAPHVIRRLVAATAGNAGAIVELAQHLTDEQLRGLRALPDPLPVTESMLAVYGAGIEQLSDAERFVLLVASVSVRSRTEVLLAATGSDMVQLIRGPLARFLDLVTGRFALSDERVRSIVHETASLAERTEAHVRLARVFDELGDTDMAAWHRSLGLLEGDSSACRTLVMLSWDALARGESVWAHAVAREAASQATGDDVAEAQLAAGVAALLAGRAMDAVDWLRGVVHAPSSRCAAHALMPWVFAATLAEGRVPDAELRRVGNEIERAGRRQGRDKGWAVAGALALAAALQAERGALEQARALLDEARLRPGVARDVIGLAAAWCDAFGLESQPLPVATQPHHRGFASVCTALQFALGGVLESASAALGGVAVDGATPLGQRHSEARMIPSALLEAHARVTKALIAAARGRHAQARAELTEAAFAGPLALPFAGLGALLASRCDIFVDGRPGLVADALADLAATTEHSRREHLIDSALMSVLERRRDRTLACLGLAAEHSAPPNSVYVLLPGVDPVTLFMALGDEESARSALTSVVSESGLGGWGEPARVRAQLLFDDEVRDELIDRAEDLSESLDSLTDRALTEVALASAIDRRGDRLGARARLATATALLLESGATALARFVRQRLASDATASAVTAEWLRGLTAREAEVAALVVTGASNLEVASALHLSVRTVEVHLGRVFRKLGVRSRTELSHVAHKTPGVSATAR